MTRATATLLFAIFVVIPPFAMAEQQARTADQLAAEIDALRGGEAGRIAPRELDRAEELLDEARAAAEAAGGATAEGLLAIVALQLRLVQEVARAAEVEAAAAAEEERRLATEREARAARDALERVLERLLALTALVGSRGGG